MINQIILASKSEVRKKILKDNKIQCTIEPSNIDEDSIKQSLLKENASPEIISKNLAELKANNISQKRDGDLVLGADSVIYVKGKINGKKHFLISSVCISKNGAMVWNYTDKASLTMKQMTEEELKTYLGKISDAALYAYNVYQIEGEGRSLFSKIEGDENTIMGLPIKKIKEYLSNYK